MPTIGNNDSGSETIDDIIIRAAIDKVLLTLGTKNKQVIAYHLKEHYNISLDYDSGSGSNNTGNQIKASTLKELETAFSDLFGGGGFMIMNLIYEEMHQQNNNGGKN